VILADRYSQKKGQLNIREVHFTEETQKTETELSPHSPASKCHQLEMQGVSKKVPVAVCQMLFNNGFLTHPRHLGPCRVRESFLRW